MLHARNDSEYFLVLTQLIVSSTLGVCIFHIFILQRGKLRHCKAVCLISSETRWLSPNPHPDSAPCVTGTECLGNMHHSVPSSELTSVRRVKENTRSEPKIRDSVVTMGSGHQQWELTEEGKLGSSL